MKKRVLSLALAILLALSLLPMGAFAADNVVTIGDFVVSNGILMSYPHDASVITIPDNVTFIPHGCFLNDDLEEVTIPSSVTFIEDMAFQCCRNLKTVTIPSSMTSIEAGVFGGCTSLTSVVIPSSVKSILWGAFIDCNSLVDVYYGGSEAQWKAIEMGEDNEPLTEANIHFTACASTQNVLVDGKSVEFECYALKDASGNDTNYIKLRDVASVLNGTAAQFNVGWDGNVNIETGKAYAANGSEMSTPYSGNRTYENATAATNIDGVKADLSAIVLKDDAGNGYTYYKLRDLGNALGFTVDWSAEKGIFIETK